MANITSYTLNSGPAHGFLQPTLTIIFDTAEPATILMPAQPCSSNDLIAACQSIIAALQPVQ